MTGAKIIADSISPDGIRVTTMQITMHRFVLAEFNTHRVFSRNFRSSRAVPVKKLLEEVRTNPAMPVFWGKNQPGMQANEEMDDKELGMDSWRLAAKSAARHAEDMMELGVHKQVANRVLEPYLFVHGVVTSTRWKNFFGLRQHPDAQPEIRVLADAMATAFEDSTPRFLPLGEWHLPYIRQEDFATASDFKSELSDEEIVRRMSVSRCARVSYRVFEDDRVPTPEEDLQTYDKLLGSQPVHASPSEHQATPDILIGATTEFPKWQNEHLHGNLHGFVQLRKTIYGEDSAPSEIWSV